MSEPATTATLPVTVWPPSAEPRTTDPHLIIAATTLKRARFLLPRIIHEVVRRHGSAAMALVGDAVADNGPDGVFAIASLLADTIIGQSGLDTAALRHCGAHPDNPPTAPRTVELPVGEPMYGTAGQAARAELAAGFLTDAATSRADLAYQFVRGTDVHQHAALVEGLLEVLAAVLDGVEPEHVLQGPDPRTAITADVHAQAQALRVGLIAACRSKDPHRAIGLFAPIVGTHGVDGAWAVAAVLADVASTVGGINDVTVATAQDIFGMLHSGTSMFGTDGHPEHDRNAVALTFIHGQVTGRRDATYAALCNGTWTPGDLLQGLCEVVAAVLADTDTTRTDAMPWDDPHFWDDARLAHVGSFADTASLAACAHDLITLFPQTPGCTLRIDEAQPGVYLLCFSHPLSADPQWAAPVKTIIERHGGVCGTPPGTIDLAHPEETP